MSHLLRTVKVACALLFLPHGALADGAPPSPPSHRIVLLTTIPRERFGGVNTVQFGWLRAATHAAGPEWSDDGSTIAYPRGDGAISVYDTRAGRTVATLSGHDVPTDYGGPGGHEVIAFLPTART